MSVIYKRLKSVLPSLSLYASGFGSENSVPVAYAFSGPIRHWRNHWKQ